MQCFFRIVDGIMQRVWRCESGLECNDSSAMWTVLCNAYWRCEGHYARVLAGLERYYATAYWRCGGWRGRCYATCIGAVRGIMHAYWRGLEGIMQRVPVLALWRNALDGIMQRVLALWRTAWTVLCNAYWRCGGSWTALCNAYWRCGGAPWTALCNAYWRCGGRLGTAVEGRLGQHYATRIDAVECGGAAWTALYNMYWLRTNETKKANASDRNIGEKFGRRSPMLTVSWEIRFQFVFEKLLRTATLE